jgi:hypothetical protein
MSAHPSDDDEEQQLERQRHDRGGTIIMPIAITPR